jgi:hypothetical protein
VSPNRYIGQLKEDNFMVVDCRQSRVNFGVELVNEVFEESPVSMGQSNEEYGGLPHPALRLKLQSAGTQLEPK